MAEFLLSFLYLPGREIWAGGQHQAEERSFSTVASGCGRSLLWQVFTVGCFCCEHLDGFSEMPSPLSPSPLACLGSSALEICVHNPVLRILLFPQLADSWAPPRFLPGDVYTRPSAALSAGSSDRAVLPVLPAAHIWITGNPLVNFAKQTPRSVSQCSNSYSSCTGAAARLSALKWISHQPTAGDTE